MEPAPIPMMMRIFLRLFGAGGFVDVVGIFVVLIGFVVFFWSLIFNVSTGVFGNGKMSVIGWIVAGSRVGFNSFLLMEQFLPSQENVIYVLLYGWIGF